VPKRTPKIHWKVVSRNPRGPRRRRRWSRSGWPAIADNHPIPSITVSLDLLLVTPEGKGRPADPGVRLPRRRALDEGPSGAARTGLARPGPRPGAGATRSSTRPASRPTTAKLSRGIIGLANRGHPRKPDDWGALRAWAWGASRAVDYFETDPAVDDQARRLEGLSRYGKAALVAMAYEPRLAVGFIASSGEGGAKLHRRKRGEQVENLAAEGEHHWMAGNFLRYAGAADRRRPAGRRPRADRPVRAPAAVHQRRQRRGRRLDRRARHVHGRRSRPDRSIGCWGPATWA
jgi:hypothetical protein